MTFVTFIFKLEVALNFEYENLFEIFYFSEMVQIIFFILLSIFWSYKQGSILTIPIGNLCGTNPRSLRNNNIC